MKSTYPTKCPITILRRELRAVFGISLTLKRTGRNKTKSYNLVLPEDLIGFAETSDFFEQTTLHKVKRSSSQNDCNVHHILLPPDQGSGLIGYMGRKPNIVGKCVVKNILYNNVDYGGLGNCLFLAVAGSLRAVSPTSV